MENWECCDLKCWTILVTIYDVAIKINENCLVKCHYKIFNKMSHMTPDSYCGHFYVGQLLPVH